jgi:hypothetical protein
MHEVEWKVGGERWYQQKLRSGVHSQELEVEESKENLNIDKPLNKE